VVAHQVDHAACLLAILGTMGAADNTPSQACGYRFGYVVHCTLSRAS
jgi:hypothetical protein